LRPFVARRSLGGTGGEVRVVRIEKLDFGSIRIDGRTYDRDVVLRKGKVSKRKKKLSKPFKGKYGHTPVSLSEEIPWACERLVIGTGVYGRLPVMEEVKREADERGVELLIMPTADAIREINRGEAHTNAILHVTC
jgi:hypothetical protein